MALPPSRFPSVDKQTCHGFDADMQEALQHWHEIDAVTTLLEDYRALCGTNTSVHHLPSGPEYNRLYQHASHLLHRVNALRRSTDAILRSTTSPLVRELGVEVMQLLPQEMNDRTTLEGELDPFAAYAVPLSPRPIARSPVWDKSYHIQTLLHSVLAYAPSSFYGQQPVHKRLPTRIRGTTTEDSLYFAQHPDYFAKNDHHYIIIHMPQWRIDVTAETVHTFRKWLTRPVGRAVYDIFPSAVDLHDLTVDNREWKKGVGADLLDDASGHLHAACNKMIVNVSEDRLDLHTYLRRMGFYARGVARESYAGRDGYIFQRRKIDRSEARKHYAQQQGIFIPHDGSLRTAKIRRSPF